MIVFSSLTSVQIYTVATIAVLLWFGTGRQPLDPVYRFFRALVTSRTYWIYLAAALAILLVNGYEVKWEAAYGVAYDLTQAWTGWEGDWHVRLQSLLRSDWLTAVCAFFYVVVFQSVIVASLGIYTSFERKKMYYAFCVALLLNYVIALPMYWFVPINEVWYAHPQVHPLIVDAFPSFEQTYRPMSGINNCFPSLHTSLSVTMALLASRSGIRRWAVFAWINAAVIVFSIFYLGIHWFTDMAAGVLLAIVSATVGLKLGDRIDLNALQREMGTASKKAFSNQ